MEKNFVTFKVKSNNDLQTKSQLRLDYKNAQKIFDRKFRDTERNFKKQQIIDLENSAKFNPTDMWSRLKKLSNPPSSRVALEIVRDDESISRDLKEILERWLKDISKLFSGVRDNPEMSFDEDFYEEILNKKQQFENLSPNEQHESNNFNSESLNNELSFPRSQKQLTK